MIIWNSKFYDITGYLKQYEYIEMAAFNKSHQHFNSKKGIYSIVKVNIFEIIILWQV